jgi:hypothetical protein
MSNCAVGSRGSRVTLRYRAPAALPSRPQTTDPTVVGVCQPEPAAPGTTVISSRHSPVMPSIGAHCAAAAPVATRAAPAAAVPDRATPWSLATVGLGNVPDRSPPAALSGYRASRPARDR